MTKEKRILAIGIASRADIEARTIAIAIARGHHCRSSDEPRVWFTSIESLAQVLSTRNTELLDLIAKARPQSIAELAALSGRHAANLSRTLTTLQRYGLVTLIDGERGRKIPVVAYDEIRLIMPLASGTVVGKAA